MLTADKYKNYLMVSIPDKITVKCFIDQIKESFHLFVNDIAVFEFGKKTKSLILIFKDNSVFISFPPNNEKIQYYTGTIDEITDDEILDEIVYSVKSFAEKMNVKLGN